jgi:phosphate transport system permease protein
MSGGPRPERSAPVDASAAAEATRRQQLAARRTVRRVGRRRRRARVMTTLTAVAAALAVAPLVAILIFLVARGAEALSPALVLRSPTPSGEGGGLANGLAGSALILGIASVLGLPVGLGTGLYLHEERGSRTAHAVRYLCDVLLGVPSIVFGIVAWGLVVRPVGHFSAWAGGVALAAMLVPVVARTTDELLALVPAPLTEAALALGFPRWRTALGVSLRAALPGVVTGALVAVARIAGETAPLLFTALGNQYWSMHPGHPIAALPLQIYVAALGASDTARRQAYAGALLLITAIALFGVAARRATRRTRRAAEWGGA